MDGSEYESSVVAELLGVREVVDVSHFSKDSHGAVVADSRDAG
jgi:hypothetical protein